jgi:hypothetical protein
MLRRTFIAGFAGIAVSAALSPARAQNAECSAQTLQALEQLRTIIAALEKNPAWLDYRDTALQASREFFDPQRTRETYLNSDKGREDLSHLMEADMVNPIDGRKGEVADVLSYIVGNILPSLVRDYHMLPVTSRPRDALSLFARCNIPKYLPPIPVFYQGKFRLLENTLNLVLLQAQHRPVPKMIDARVRQASPVVGA